MLLVLHHVILAYITFIVFVLLCVCMLIFSNQLLNNLGKARDPPDISA